MMKPAVQGVGDVCLPVRPRPSAEQLRGSEGGELAGDDVGRKARPESRQHRIQGTAVYDMISRDMSQVD